MAELFKSPTVIAAIVAAFIGLYWNFRNAKKVRMVPFLQRQLDLCFEASELVATLATTTNLDVWQQARERFWQLYFGPLAIVEDTDVEAFMVKCGQKILKADEKMILPVTALQGASLQLSEAIRRLLLKTWEIKSLDLALKGHKSIAEVFHETYVHELTRSKKV